MSDVYIVDSAETIDATAAYALATVMLDRAIAEQKPDKVCRELFSLAAAHKRTMLEAQIADVKAAKAAYLARAFDEAPPAQ